MVKLGNKRPTSHQPFKVQSDAVLRMNSLGTWNNSTVLFRSMGHQKGRKPARGKELLASVVMTSLDAQGKRHCEDLESGELNCGSHVGALSDPDPSTQVTGTIGS